jgi:hypothetical protein
VISKIDRRTINRGETLGFTFGIDRMNAALACEITILPKRGGSDLITPRNIPVSPRGVFTGTLTEAETDLAPGEYFLVATITGTDVRREIEQRFTVREGW